MSLARRSCGERPGGPALEGHPGRPRNEKARRLGPYTPKMKNLLAPLSLSALALSVLAVSGAPEPLASPSITQVPSVLTCAGKKAVKPANYVLACADANTYFSKIHWRSWGKTSASANATFVQDDCLPTCVQGKFVKYPATLTLSKPKATKLGLLFSVVNYSFTVSRSTTLPLAALAPQG